MGVVELSAKLTEGIDQSYSYIKVEFWVDSLAIPSESAKPTHLPLLSGGYGKEQKRGWEDMEFGYGT